VSAEEYNENIRKTEAADSKKADKAKAIEEGKHLIIIMDLQSLFLCPNVEASCLLLKTKLCCHNFTLFDLTTKSVLCYFFNETAADFSASTFASCIFDHLKTRDLTGFGKSHLYSDDLYRIGT